MEKMNPVENINPLRSLYNGRCTLDTLLPFSVPCLSWPWPLVMSQDYSNDNKRDSNDTKRPDHEGEDPVMIDRTYPVWAEDTENNPRLWSTRKKWTMVFLVAFYTFVR